GSSSCSAGGVGSAVAEAASPREVRRTSAMRERQRSMTAILARTTSRSTMRDPPQDGLLDRASHQGDVLVAVGQAGEKRDPPSRRTIGDEPARFDRLMSDDRRGGVEVDDVDGP